MSQPQHRSGDVLPFPRHAHAQPWCQQDDICAAIRTGFAGRLSFCAAIDKVKDGMQCNVIWEKGANIATLEHGRDNRGQPLSRNRYRSPRREFLITEHLNYGMNCPVFLGNRVDVSTVVEHASMREPQCRESALPNPSRKSILHYHHLFLNGTTPLLSRAFASSKWTW